MNDPLERSPEAQRIGLTADDHWRLADSGAFENYATTDVTVDTARVKR